MLTLTKIKTRGLFHANSSETRVLAHQWFAVFFLLLMVIQLLAVLDLAASSHRPGWHGNRFCFRGQCHCGTADSTVLWRASGSAWPVEKTAGVDWHTALRIGPVCDLRICPSAGSERGAGGCGRRGFSGLGHARGRGRDRVLHGAIVASCGP